MARESHNNNVGLDTLRRAFRSEVPIVGVFGQHVGWTVDRPDPILKPALDRLQRDKFTWKALLSREPFDPTFYEWLGERFARRAPSEGLELIGDAPLSSAFTSSLDPGFVNLFATKGREPDPVLMGDPAPRVLRSRRRPSIHYLFGRAGIGIGETQPPISAVTLSQRRIRHALPMLRNVTETATALEV